MFRANGDSANAAYINVWAEFISILFVPTIFTPFAKRSILRVASLFVRFAYKKLLDMDNIYSASVCSIINSTDY